MAADRDLRRRREVADVNIVVVADGIQYKCGFRVLQFAGKCPAFGSVSESAFSTTPAGLPRNFVVVNESMWNSCGVTI